MEEIESVSIRGTEIEKCLLAYADMSTYNVYSWKDVTIDLTHSNTVTASAKRRLERDAKRCWNGFYKDNETNFYKDRHYLHLEFEGIIQKDKKSVLLEIGCGVGNAFFPLLKLDPNLFVSAIDLSDKAIEFVKKNEFYDEKRCDVYACDITKQDLPRSISNRGADNVLLLFVLSAIAPDNMLITMRRAVSVLKIGGHFFFRDYGRGDHAQMRFKDNGHKLEENFYVRNDGTRAYYFTVDEIRRLFRLVGLSVVKLEYIRRTDTNKKTGKSWDRVWIQGSFVKKE